MNKKIIFSLSAFVVIILILGFVVFGFGPLEENGDFEEVSMRLPVPIIDGLFSQYFVGIDKGFYEGQGLDVTFNPGSSETNPIKMVASGADEFGLAGGPELVLIGRSKGLPLVAVAVIQRDSDFTQIVALKDSGITKLEDLEGKKVGFNYGHISTDILHTLFNKNQISVEEVSVGYDYSQLLTGNVDAQWAFRAYAPVNLQAKGKEIEIISPSDYGITTDGLTIFTTEKIIEERPDLVEKFLRGVFDGTEFAIENPQEALKSITNRYPELDPAIEIQRTNIILEDASNSEDYPVGYLDEEMFQRAYDRLEGEGLLENEFDVELAFTEKFVNKIHEKE